MGPLFEIVNHLMDGTTITVQHYLDGSIVYIFDFCNRAFNTLHTIFTSYMHI